jgi:hypothetical protein
VSLRPDQYDILKRWRCDCFLFVSALGDVKVSKELISAVEGTIFATSSYQTYSRDEEGYPICEGIRAISAQVNFYTVTPALALSTAPGTHAPNPL